MGDTDDYLRRAALRREQLEKVKAAAAASRIGSSPSTGSEHVKENASTTSVKSFAEKPNVPDRLSPSSGTSTAVPEHTKLVLAQIAEQYQSIDEEDSHSEVSSTSFAHSLRHPSHQARVSPVKKPTRPPVSPLAKVTDRSPREKREHVTSGSSPLLHAPKMMRAGEVRRTTPRKSIEPSELPLQERKAMFEKAAAGDSPQSHKVTASPRKGILVTSSPNALPSEEASQKARKVLFETVAAKSQEPNSLNSTASLKSPKKFTAKPVAVPVQDDESQTGLPEAPKEVGVFTRTLQDKLLDQSKAWRQNDVAKRIEEEKERDMQVLRHRWQLMAEEEQRAGERQKLIHKMLAEKKIKRPGSGDEQVPPPLPLPGHSSLHDVTMKDHSEYSDLPPPVFSPQSPKAPFPDAVARFQNPGLKASGHGHIPPPPPPPVVPNTSRTPQKRVKLPEEEGLSTPSSGEDSEGMQIDYEDRYHERRAKSFERSKSIERTRESGNDSRVMLQRNHSDHHRSSPYKSASQTAKSIVHNKRDDDNYSDTQSSNSGETGSSATAPISLSFYRKAQREANLSTPKRVSIPTDRKSDEEDQYQRARLLARSQQFIEHLYQTASQQQSILTQTTVALNRCRTMPEFQCSTERAECERLLLLGAKAREACHTEISRMKSLMNTIKEGGSLPDFGCHGKVTITHIVLPTKDGFVEYAAEEATLPNAVRRILSNEKGFFRFFTRPCEVDHMHYFVIILRHRDEVHATQMVNSVNHLQADGTFHFPGQIVFEDLESDFVITLEVYAVQAPREKISHDEKYHIKGKTPKKDKATSKKIHSGGKDGTGDGAPGTYSKHEIRTSSFGCVGSCSITLQNIHKDVFTLNKVPEASALEGTMTMDVGCDVVVDSTEEGFLTIFEECCGPAAWHRRWCRLENGFLCLWKYPEERDANVKPQELNLRWCKSDVENVSSTVCPRAHTFQLWLSRPLKLSGEPKERGPYRYLFSADGKEQRFIWGEKLNKSIRSVRAWSPSDP